MGDRLATINMGRKEGELPCPFRGELGPHLTQCGLSRGLPQYTKWHPDPSSRLATTDMGQKLGCVPLVRRGSWVPIYHNVALAEAYLYAKFHLDPSSRLATIHRESKKGTTLTMAMTFRTFQIKIVFFELK